MNDKAASIFYQTMNRLHNELERIESIEAHLKNVRENITIARGIDQKVIDSLRRIHLRTEETLQQLKKITQVTDTNLRELSHYTGQQVESIRSINFPQQFDMVFRYLEATKELLKISTGTQQKLVSQNENLEKQLQEIREKLEIFETRLHQVEHSFTSQKIDIKPHFDNVSTTLTEHFDNTGKRFTEFEEHAFFLLRNFYTSVNLKTNLTMGITIVVGLILLITLLIRT
jgi:chromosome segregation ATPase